MTTDLKGVSLGDSSVLGWRVGPDSVEFAVDFSLWPGSRFYRDPRKGEWTCYRRGFLRFSAVTAVEGLKPQAEVPFATDASGEKDFGSIEALEEQAGAVVVAGDFGTVTIRCSSWAIEIEE